jgi:hypothetical protein
MRRDPFGSPDPAEDKHTRKTCASPPAVPGLRNSDQRLDANQFVLDQRIDPCMGEVFAWDKIPAAHQMMWKNEHKPGNMAVLVSAPRPGCRTLDDAMETGEE